jgi:hypothetical protein
MLGRTCEVDQRPIVGERHVRRLVGSNGLCNGRPGGGASQAIPMVRLVSPRTMPGFNTGHIAVAGGDEAHA